jgi:hypothetical protein
MRSIRVAATPGTGAPTTSASTTTTLPRGEVRGTFRASGPFDTDLSACTDPDAFGQLRLDFTIDATTLGHATTSITFCTLLTNDSVSVGTYTLDADGGTLTGGNARFSPSGEQTAMRLDISSGTGAFAGASGSLQLDGNFVFAPGPVGTTYDGTISGTLSLP